MIGTFNKDATELFAANWKSIVQDRQKEEQIGVIQGVGSGASTKDAGSTPAQLIQILLDPQNESRQNRFDCTGRTTPRLPEMSNSYINKKQTEEDKANRGG